MKGEQLTLFDMPPSLKEMEELEEKFANSGVGPLFSHKQKLEAAGLYRETWPDWYYEIGKLAIYCETYWDQKHYIGEDAMGHACANMVHTIINYKDKLYNVCVHCYAELIKGTSRIGFEPGKLPIPLVLEGLTVKEKQV
jgi:hypothetical protein